MYKYIGFIIILGLLSLNAFSATASNCRSMMLDFIAKADKKENVELLKNSWTQSQKKKFIIEVKSLGFSNSNIKIMIESLNWQRESADINHVRKYLIYVLGLSDKDQKVALMDLAQLDSHEVNSKFIKKFIAHENKILEKIKANKLTSKVEQKRYEELYYGCRSLRPNEVNKGATKDFKRFNLALNLGTLGASYAYFNMDKDINAEWFEKLGYDVGVTLMLSYVGGNIQTKVTDSQMVKSLKSYFLGRAAGITDIAIFDPIFNKEHEEAQKRIEDLKQDPQYKEKILELQKSYQSRGIYRKYKNEIISTLKKLPDRISLGIKGNSIDENNIDWNNLTQADLDRSDVQEVLVAAAMAQIYNESKGQWIDSDDAGLDKYAFSSVFNAILIPKSIAQNFITYRMLCMGQDNAAMSFAKAALFNVSSNFIVNQLFYSYRKKAINQ
jgi:DNA-binding transcriptional MerR regulator